MDLPARIAYADCFSGISGDMLLGALLHAGLDEGLLRRELAKLNLADFSFEITAQSVQSIACQKVTISTERRQDLRTLPALMKILENSNLDEAITVRSAKVFTAIAEAEAKVHGIAVDKVHFHEVGALDTIIDVVGTVIGLFHLGISKLFSSPLPLGSGFVQCAHGRLPLPAPAVCELLHNIPTYGVDHTQELVTPTGAALLKVLADDFGPMPPMSISATGYGAGTHILANHQPNLLRLILGIPAQVDEAQSVVVIETHLDDWNPEGFPYVCELLFKQAALDVSLAPIQMKKGRPGYCLKAICSPAHAQQIKEVFLSETTAIGLRYREEKRQTLPREKISVTTPWGNIWAKKVYTPTGTVIYPEYEECKTIALRHHIPLNEVYRAVSCTKEETK